MLSGFECDDDHTGWLAGLVAWSVGAAVACFFAVETIEPVLPHWQVLALAVAVSLVSLGLRLPVLLLSCSDRAWLVHAVWMFALFAQINWAGFLAARSSSGTIAAEAMLICLGLEAWMLVRAIGRGELPWLQQFISGTAMVETAEIQLENTAHLKPAIGELPNEVEDEEDGDIRREYVDGIDENGQRYVSGSVRVHLHEQQRTETFALSFCPALDGVAEVELECESEDATAKVENATETGARITVRRTQVGEDAFITVAWFATASQTSAQSVNLP